MTEPPEGYRIRPPRESDIPAIVDLIRCAEEVDQGRAERTEEDVKVAHRTMDTERNVRVVEAREGHLAATTAVRPRLPPRIHAFVAVAPEERGRGLGTALATLVEARAREILAEAGSDADVALAQGVGQLNDGARALLERHGYRFVRRFWRMGVELDGEQPDPRWAEGIRVRTVADGVADRDVFDAMEDAFRDHWGFVPHDYAEWRAWGVERESFDPSLWFIAVDGDEIAGASLGAVEDEQAWINVLGVRRPWRRRGVGLALLLASFAAFRRRGYANVVLEVDSENPTGATRLYERAGMRVVRFSDAYEQTLRA